MSLVYTLNSALMTLDSVAPARPVIEGHGVTAC